MVAILPPAPVGAPFTDYSWVDWYQKIQRAINDSGTVTHNATTGLQGGGGGDYYHLSAVQYASITTNLSETIDDRVASLIQNGTGITWSYNDGAGTLTPTVSLGAYSTTNLSEGANLYYTDERVDDRVSNLLVAGTNVTLTYNDVANTLTVDATGGSSTYTETIVNFGTKPVWDAKFTVTDAGVSPSSKITVMPGGTASGRSDDDWQWDQITFNAVAGSGQFTLYANCSGPVEGTRSIYYQVF